MLRYFFIYPFGETCNKRQLMAETLCFVLGSVLVIGAAVVLITRKRMGKSDK